ncbi:hypothetical protein ABPG72_012105 [Tetrahymena utriculariae]
MMDIEYNLSDKQKEAIRKYKVVVMHFSGNNYESIEKETLFAKGTISKLIQKFNEFGDVLIDKRIFNQRPEILTDSSKQMIEETMVKDNRTTLKEMKTTLIKECDQSVCEGTIYNYEKQIVSFKYPQVVPILSLINQQKRLDYAIKHKDDAFSNTIFSDESSFVVFRSTKKRFVLNGNPKDQVDIIKTIPEKASKLFGTSWRFQQDNAPAHKANSLTSWLEGNVPNLINHPPQSPDLNPIELIWGWMKNQIENHSPQNKDELKELQYDQNKMQDKQTQYNIYHLCSYSLYLF